MSLGVTYQPAWCYSGTWTHRSAEGHVASDVNSLINRFKGRSSTVNRARTISGALQRRQLVSLLLFQPVPTIVGHGHVLAMKQGHQAGFVTSAAWCRDN